MNGSVVIFIKITIESCCLEIASICVKILLFFRREPRFREAVPIVIVAQLS